MEPLTIPQTPSTPFVCYDESRKTLTIAGESYPENSFAFYTPVLGWLRRYLQEERKLILDITVTYLNSSSIKCMLDVLDTMEEAFGKGADLSILWRYDLENPRSFELAEEFCEEVTFPFEIIAHHT